MSNVIELAPIPFNKSSISLEYYSTSDSVICEIKANDIDPLAAMYGVLTTQLIALGYLSEPNIYGIVAVAAEEANKQKGNENERINKNQ